MLPIRLALVAAGAAVLWILRAKTRRNYRIEKDPAAIRRVPGRSYLKLWESLLVRVLLVNDTDHKLDVIVRDWPKGPRLGEMTGAVGANVEATGATVEGSGTDALNDKELPGQEASVEPRDQVGSPARYRQRNHVGFYGSKDSAQGLCFTVLKHSTGEAYVRNLQVPFKHRLIIFGEP